MTNKVMSDIRGLDPMRSDLVDLVRVTGFVYVYRWADET